MPVPSYIFSDDASNIVVVASSPYPTASKLHSSTTLRKRGVRETGVVGICYFSIRETAGHMGQLLPRKHNERRTRLGYGLRKAREEKGQMRRRLFPLLGEKGRAVVHLNVWV